MNNYSLEERVGELRDALTSMVWQFATRGVNEHGRFLGTMGLSALEGAFEVLGWDDPHYIEGMGCQAKGCEEWATAGIMVGTTYMRVCSDHIRQDRDP